MMAFSIPRDPVPYTYVLDSFTMSVHWRRSWFAGGRRKALLILTYNNKLLFFFVITTVPATVFLWSLVYGIPGFSGLYSDNFPLTIQKLNNFPKQSHKHKHTHYTHIQNILHQYYHTYRQS